MPSLHPRWTDASAVDPVDGRYYGTTFSAAHLVARALLFHDAPGPLLAVYDASEGKPGSAEWYSMRNLGVAGPTLRVRLLGTSGTVTTLASIVLNLEKYRRALVDGIALSRQDAAR